LIGIFKKLLKFTLIFTVLLILFLIGAFTVFFMFGGLIFSHLPGNEEITLEDAREMYPPDVVHLAEIGLKLNKGAKLQVRNGKLHVVNKSGVWMIGGSDIYTTPDDAGREWWKKVIEKIDEDEYRVTIAYYDAIFTNKYLTVNFTISPKENTGYTVTDTKDRGYVDPGYYKLIDSKIAKWSTGNRSGNISIYYYQDPNPLDTRIVKKIAKRIDEFAKENNLNNTQKVILTAEIIRILLIHVDNDRVYIYENGRLIPSNVKATNSRIVQDILEGTVCRGFAEWTSRILNELGIEAGNIGIYQYATSNVLHGVTWINAQHIDLDYLETLINKKVTVFKIEDNNLQFILCDPTMIVPNIPRPAFEFYDDVVLEDMTYYL